MIWYNLYQNYLKKEGQLFGHCEYQTQTVTD